MLLPLGAEGVGSVNLDILYFSLLSLVALLLEHNVDKKSMRNNDARIRVKLEVKVPIDIFFRRTSQSPFPPPKTNDPRKKFTLLQKNLTQAEKFNPPKKN